MSGHRAPGIKHHALGVKILAAVPTRPGQTRALLDELVAGEDPITVEAAIARLAIIGRPALRPVLERITQADVAHLPRLFGVLERIGAPGALPVVRGYLTHASTDVAVAAVDAVGALLDAHDAEAATGALDALTATLLDHSRPDAVRVRAFEAIANAPDRSATYEADVVAPLRRALEQDPSAALRQAAAGAGATSAAAEASSSTSASPLEVLAAATGPDAADALRQAITAQGGSASLTTLHRVIERVRAREAEVGDQARADAWRVARATAHLALASRGSRLAVYDLRETLEALGDKTPVGMLAALQQVGDASVLEAVTEACHHTANAWFRGQLAGIFRAVVSREQITRRSAAVKKLSARFPETIAELWG